MRADLRRFYGIDLANPGMPLAELADLAAHLPAESATHRLVNPAAIHTHELELQRSIEHSLRWLVWAKTPDGSKGRNIPKPYLFPWEQPEPEHDAVTWEEAGALWHDAMDKINI